MKTNVFHTLRLGKLLASLILSLLFFQAILLSAQDQDQDDPPGRVARSGYLQGTVSFQPAGESDWVEAVRNRPMTIGDKLWSDRDSRAEVELGSAAIHLGSDTGFSFLNLDDRTVQVDLNSGVIDVSVRRIDRDEVFEIDTPNQALTVFQPGQYRIEASEDGNYTVVTVRQGEAESTGNGQRYAIRAGQRMTLRGTQSLSAEVQQIGNPDDFDNWSYSRERRYENGRSAQYCSRDVVGAEDLDDYGDWRAESAYGNVWFPRVSAGWAPYHEGHWAWIEPWGWTWVDDDPWGYAPFHYGRWASFGGRWGWVPGPREVRTVYAPALVVFVGGGPTLGENVGWFPLGPREVYVPSYRGSPAYVNRVNVTNTNVNTKTITNVYNTTIVNKTTTITNVNYVNRNVQGAVTAVPQRTFASAQPVARSAVSLNPRQIAAVPAVARVPVTPTREAVLGAHANTAGRVAAPPRAVTARPVIAKVTPPPAPPSFSARQPALQAHPGQPLAKPEMQKLRPAEATATPVKKAPPSKPATPVQAANQPAPNARPSANPSPATATPPRNEPAPNNRPEANRPESNRPEANRPESPASGNGRTPAAEPNNRPEPTHPEPNRAEPNRPEANRPEATPSRNDRPSSAEPNNRPEPNRPEPNRAEPNRPEANRPEAAPPRNDRPSSAEPNNRPEPNRPEPNRAEPNRPEANRPEATPSRNDRPSSAEPNNRPEPNRPEPNRAEPNRPEANRPEAAPPRNDRPSSTEPNNRPEPNRPESNRAEPNRPEANRPEAAPPRNDRPSSAEPNNRPEPNRPEPNRAEPNRPEPNGSEPTRPESAPARIDRPSSAQPNSRQESTTPPKSTEEKNRQRQSVPEPQPPQ